MLPTVSSSKNQNDEEDRFPLEIDLDNRCYNIFDRQIKCSHDALKTFHRCSEAILERDPELYNIWIDDQRFYAHGIVEVIENELSSLHHKCLYSNLKPLQGFRWLEGLLLVLGSYSKYFKELNDPERLDALLNLFFAAWITFFIHNRYAILHLTTPIIQTDANNNSNENHDDCMIVENQEKKTSHATHQKSEEQILRHLDKHLPNFRKILDEVIELGHQLASKRLPNLEKLEALFRSWKDPVPSRRRNPSGEFSLIIKRITHPIDLPWPSDQGHSSPSQPLDWKMVFYDEFLRYADRFYLIRKPSPSSSSKRRTIGGERFCINKWSSTKINYFLTKNLLKRRSDHEYEQEIEQLYQ